MTGTQAVGRLQVAVFLSGTGRTLENLLQRRAAGELDIDIPVVISSRPAVRGLEIAAAAGIEAHVVRRRDYPPEYRPGSRQCLRRIGST